LTNEIRIVTKYLHNDSDQLENLWDYDAPQQYLAARWLYEVPFILEVDMDTGSAYVTHVFGQKLESPVRA
jgi:hypothetical protein